jgi:hypothetical protein
MRAMAVVLTLALWLAAGAAFAHAQGPNDASVNGSVSDAVSGAPIAGAVVSATGSLGDRYSTTTDGLGEFAFDDVVAPESYTLEYEAAGYQRVTTSSGPLTPGETITIPQTLAPLPGAVAGVVRDQSGPLYGMIVTVQAQPSGFPYRVTSGPDGSFTVGGLDPGSYQLTVQDGNTPVSEGTLTVNRGATTVASPELGPARVPAGTAAQFAARDLGYLNGERSRLGLPAGIALNTRWSTECAAHDAYLHDNHVIEHPEDPIKPGASIGGAWAGTSSVLSEGAHWSAGANPWENAPIHLDQLLAPSLSVIGIDDSDGYQCTTTFRGMLRAPTGTDTIYTYPGNHARGFATSEQADEWPFVPGQFVGIPPGSTAGRELFVYLNEAGEVGQSQVRIVRASLATGNHKARLRWVDSSTREIGPYLAGGILIPVKPLRSGSLYHASVTVADGTRMLIDNWSFRTARNQRGAHPESGKPRERSGHGDRHWATKRGARR